MLFNCKNKNKNKNKQLIGLIENEITITNLALDETTLDDLLHGKNQMINMLKHEKRWDYHHIKLMQKMVKYIH